MRYTGTHSDEERLHPFLRTGNESRRPGFLTKPVEPEQLLRVVNEVFIDATNHFLEQQRLFELCKITVR